MQEVENEKMKSKKREAREKMKEAFRVWGIKEEKKKNFLERLLKL